MKYKNGDIAYAFWANGYGVWHNTPQKVVFRSELNSWWHKNGDDDCKKIGLDCHDGCICFCSRNKKEAQLFIDGFMACTKILKNFVGVYEKY